MGLLNVGPIIIILFVFSVLMFLFFARGSQAKRRTSSSKKRPLFFMFYGTILVVSLIVYLVLPNENVEQLEERAEDFDGVVPFYGVMNGDMSVESIEEFKQTENTYPMTGDTLDFTESNEDDYFRTVNILLIQDSSFTDEFKVETYETPFIYEGKDISAFVESVGIGANDGVVHIHLPKQDTVLKMYDYSFPFTQFLEGRYMSKMSGSYQISSEQLFVIYIPEDVTPDVAHITGSDLYHIELLTEE